MPLPGTTMHAKSDSEVTSLDAASSPPRSPRRPLYYVQSPSQHDVEKMSYGWSPVGSPAHQYNYSGGTATGQFNLYRSSPVHHSRESSTSRFSASLKNHRISAPWKKLPRGTEGEDADDDDDDDLSSGHSARFYVVCFVLSFVVLFTAFSLILWAASTPYEPKVVVKNIVFEKLNIQAGTDDTGVATDMLTLNSTVRIWYRNPATFFGVHVTSTPLELFYYQLKVASGQVKKFYQSRKSQRTVVAMVVGSQVPLYGGISVLGTVQDRIERMVVPLNLTFVIRSRAYVLGRLVEPKFYKRIRCPITLRGNGLGKPNNLTHSCFYD
ncbi:uncharacterized protein LOC131156586 [Malania oleifera]|uniref:uncharacterized protein LOC131156586 n=1 Tax=Malania oleifera TaxID=397392 RepID=UPI0025AE6368|nr:uncharacterized protein LOC131156586 [Malania oleifera]